MGIIATTLEQQIKTLESRGMVFDMGTDKVKEVLLDIGYYRLGFYWHPFEIDSNHNLATGTKFSDVVELYYLDSDLRHLLTKYLNRIEINFRTKMVYYVSNKYKQAPTWFIDPKVVNQDFIRNIDRYYSEEFKKSNKPINLHHQKYINHKYAPAWKTLEFFSFGIILKIYKNLIESDIQERISKAYNVNTVSKFQNLMDTLVLLRNTCAHCGVLYDLKKPTGIASIPGLNLNLPDRSSLDSCIRVMLYILGSISENRKQELIEDLDKIYEKRKKNDVMVNIVENEIKYVYKN